MSRDLIDQIPRDFFVRYVPSKEEVSDIRSYFSDIAKGLYLDTEDRHTCRRVDRLKLVTLYEYVDFRNMLGKHEQQYLCDRLIQTKGNRSLLLPSQWISFLASKLNMFLKSDKSGLPE